MGRKGMEGMNLKPIRVKRIYVEIVDQIKELFATGNLRPGDKLPSERDLAERLQVSRASVREALSALEAMGLLEVRHGEGTFIRETGVDNIIEPLALLLMMERDKSRELFEVRKMMEVEAAGLASQRALPEELERVKAILSRMQKDISHGELGEEADLEFHFAIAEMAHNSLLLRLMNTIGDAMRQGLMTARLKLYAEADNARILFEQHWNILEAIEGRNKEKAQEAMLTHLIFVEQNLLD